MFAAVPMHAMAHQSSPKLPSKRLKRGPVASSLITVLIATGDSLDRASWLAVELETLVKRLYDTLLGGGRKTLSDAQIDKPCGRFLATGCRIKTGPQTI